MFFLVFSGFASDFTDLVTVPHFESTGTGTLWSEFAERMRIHIQEPPNYMNR